MNEGRKEKRKKGRSTGRKRKEILSLKLTDTSVRLEGKAHRLLSFEYCLNPVACNRNEEF